MHLPVFPCARFVQPSALHFSFSAAAVINARFAGRSMLTDISPPPLLPLLLLLLLPSPVPSPLGMLSPPIGPLLVATPSSSSLCARFSPCVALASSALP